MSWPVAETARDPVWRGTNAIDLDNRVYRLP
jgi:hypothetical protein